MDTRPVLFLDSGIGGIPYCREFMSRNPHESIFYLADRQNFPYGPRSKEEIASFLISLTKQLQEKINPKMAVLACNTASIAALDPLRKHFPNFPFVGTVPAIKPAASACKSGKVGVLATGRTIENIRSLHLADNTGCELIGIAAPELVVFIEQRLEKADAKEKAEIVKKYVDQFRAAGVDVLVLGCTHFLFLHDEFCREASSGSNPVIQIFDSLEGITKRIEYLLDENNGELRAGKDSKPVRKLLLTGAQPPDPVWETRAKGLGFNLCLLSEV
jgi:glutamate racemase